MSRCVYTVYDKCTNGRRSATLFVCFCFQFSHSHFLHFYLFIPSFCHVIYFFCIPSFLPPSIFTLDKLIFTLSLFIVFIRVLPLSVGKLIILDREARLIFFSSLTYTQTQIIYSSLIIIHMFSFSFFCIGNFS